MTFIINREYRLITGIDMSFFFTLQRKINWSCMSIGFLMLRVHLLWVSLNLFSLHCFISSFFLCVTNRAAYAASRRNRSTFPFPGSNVKLLSGAILAYLLPAIFRLCWKLMPRLCFCHLWGQILNVNNSRVIN